MSREPSTRPPDATPLRPEPVEVAPRRDLDAPIASESLFAGRREVQIAHRGVLYRLRHTTLGKLILTK